MVSQRGGSLSSVAAAYPPPIVGGTLRGPQTLGRRKAEVKRPSEAQDAGGCSPSRRRQCSIVPEFDSSLDGCCRKWYVPEELCQPRTQLPSATPRGNYNGPLKKCGQVLDIIILVAIDSFLGLYIPGIESNKNLSHVLCALALSLLMFHLICWMLRKTSKLRTSKIVGYIYLPSVE